MENYQYNSRARDLHGHILYDVVIVLFILADIPNKRITAGAHFPIYNGTRTDDEAPHQVTAPVEKRIGKKQPGSGQHVDSEFEDNKVVFPSNTMMRNSRSDKSRTSRVHG